jgi:cytochrome c oxidase cbb3-type subunit 3
MWNRPLICTLIAASVAAALCLSAQEPPPRPAPKKGGGMLAQAGSADKHVVDDAAAERGKKTYVAECITCHGASARGSQNGPDLVRSTMLLHDRYGSTIGPFLKKGHQTQSGTAAQFTDAQILDLSHFLHARLDDTLRTSPMFHVQNVLTGDAKAGAAFFNGAGKCKDCHSVSGDLKGFGGKYDPVDVQQRFLFPGGGFGRGRSATQLKVTVTPASGSPVSGILDRIDDFNVSLRDASGEYHSWTRTPSLKVEVTDPLDAHHKLLDVITDKNMHDVTAYLETLK